MNKQRINLYNPHQTQRQVIKDTHRFKVLSCGRRWGKTTLAINELLFYALLDEKTDYWYIAPTYSQAKTIAWRYLIQQYRRLPEQLQLGKNESELWVEVGNGSRITLKGAENEDSLRGSKLGGLVIDEIASIKNFPYLWDEALRPALTDKKGWGLFISTPKGYNHFYELFSKQDIDYKSFHFTSYDNPFLDPTEIDKAKTELTEDAFGQEYLAEFKKFTGLVFKEFSRDLHIVDDVPQSALFSYYRAMDFGAVNPTVCLYITVDRDDNFWVFDEYYQSEKTTDHHAGQILSRYSHLPFRYTFGDPSGKQEIIDYARWGLHISPANKQIIDSTGKLKDVADDSWVLHRIDLISQRLKVNAITKKPRIFISKNCKNLLKEFESYRWDEKKTHITDNPVKEDDHAIDALGYFVCSYRKQQQVDRQPPALKVNSITGY